MFLVYNTRTQAETANNRIINNVLGYLRTEEPQSVRDNGLIGRNAATLNLEPDKQLTTSWSDIFETVEGRFAIVAPDERNLTQPLVNKTLPPATARAGVGGQLVETIEVKVPENSTP
jgi:hypothetical protein